jgi:hypothetical protein
MGFLQSFRTLRMLLLVVVLGVGACAGVQEQVEQGRHFYDKTEVDLEYGRPEASERYHRPRGVQSYISDETEVDLVHSRAPQSENQGDVTPLPLQPNAPSAAPLPGGGR